MSTNTAQPMKTYNHNGIEITFNETNARFSARIGNKTEFAPSLEAIRKKIDKAKLTDFQPFDALSYHSYWRPVGNESPEMRTIQTLRVTGIEKPKGKRSWNNEEKFTVEYTGTSTNRWRNTSSMPVVVRDTKENRELIQKLYDLRVNAEKEIAKLEKEIDFALAQIPNLTASDYLKTDTIP